MSGRTRNVKLLLLAAVAVSTLVLSHASAGGGDEKERVGARVAPLPPADEPFSPSNARTEDGRLIPSEQFFPAARCAGCHKDTHEAWSESLHRNAGREPFYK